MPSNPSDRHQLPIGLGIYLVKTIDGEIWAGWFRRGNAQLIPSNEHAVTNYLAAMFAQNRQQGDAGILNLANDALNLNASDPSAAFCGSTGLKPKMVASSQLVIQQGTTGSPSKAVNKQSKKKPIHSKNKSFGQIKRSEDEIIDSLFSEDSDYSDSADNIIVETNTRLRRRNQKAIADLKDLYNHKCQISSKKYLFKKKGGEYYTEAHHLVPLGEGGADSPLNVVVLSPLIHRMLHYADVDRIDLSKIKPNPDGTGSLSIHVNGKKHKITWKAKHYQMIMKYHQ